MRNVLMWETDVPNHLRVFSCDWCHCYPDACRAIDAMHIVLTFLHPFSQAQFNAEQSH